MKSGFLLSVVDYVACRSQLFAFSVQVIAGEDSHLEGPQVIGVREEEGVETMEMAEAMVVETSTVGVETSMAGGNMDIGMATGEGFQAVEATGIREVIIWEQVVAA